MALLTEQLSAVPAHRVTSALDIRLGSDLQVERRRLRESADVVVELDSAAAGWDEHSGSTARRPIRVALEGRPRGVDRTADVVHCANQPFSQCPNRRARLRFIGGVLDLIHDRLRETVTPAGPALPDSAARRLADRRALDGEPVPPRAGVTSLASDALTEPGPRGLGEPVLAVDRLLEWATDSSQAARACARCSGMSAWARPPPSGCSPRSCCSCVTATRRRRCRSCSTCATCPPPWCAPGRACRRS